MAKPRTQRSKRIKCKKFQIGKKYKTQQIVLWLVIIILPSNVTPSWTTLLSCPVCLSRNASNQLTQLNSSWTRLLLVLLECNVICLVHRQHTPGVITIPLCEFNCPVHSFAQHTCGGHSTLLPLVAELAGDRPCLVTGRLGVKWLECRTRIN